MIQRISRDRAAHRRNSGGEFARLPAMIRRMTFFDRNENAATGRANFSAGAQCSLNSRAIVRQIDNFGGKKDRIARWSRSKQFNRIFRRDRAGRVILFRALHQMVGGGPVAMTIE